MAEDAFSHAVHLAQLLHDALQQELYGVQIKFTMIRKEAEAAGREKLLEETGEAARWLEGAIETTKNLTVDLSPPVLQGEGLAEALGWLRSKMEKLHGLEVEIEAERRLP